MMNKNYFGMDLHFYEEYQPICPLTEVQLLFVMEGRMQVNIGLDTYTFDKDGVIVLNTGQSCRLDLAANTLICVITVSPEFLHRELQGDDVYFQCNSAVDNDKKYSDLKHIIGNLLVEYSVDMNCLSLKKKALLFQLADQLLRRFVLERRGSLPAQFQDPTLAGVIRYLNEHFREPVSLNTAAASAYMNTSAFSRYFKKKMGINFLEFLLFLRLKNAREDLLHTEKPLMEIALDNGFTNPSMFSKSFKKVYGVAPSEYRKSFEAAFGRKMLPVENVSDNQYQERVASLVRSNFGKDQGELFHVRTKIDAKKVIPCKNPWNRCINAGSAISILQAQMQECLCEMKEDLGISYVRITNIFSWEMRIRKDRSSVSYNFNMIDMVLDFLLSNNLKPVLDTAQKPSRIILNPEDIIPLEREDSVFQTLKECKQMVEEFLKHIVQRYGVQEVESWIFDLGVNPMMDLGDEYLEMFDAVSGIIKSHVPEALVGGCCIPPEYLNCELLREWFDEHRRPDFLSLTVFPYQLTSGDSDDRDREPLIPSSDVHFFHNVLFEVKNLLKSCGAQELPVILSEWNLTFSDRNFYNDSCGKAAQMLKLMTECLQDTEMAAYLYATDLGLMNYDTNALLFGGTGLMNKDGLAKPSYYAMYFMNQLDSQLVGYGDRYMVTTDKGNSFHILLFNYKPFHYNYYRKAENEITAEDVPGLFADADAFEMEIELTGLSDGQYNIHSETVGVENGSILSAWRELNYERFLSRQEQRFLKCVSIPHISIRRQYAEQGRLILSEHLNAHDIRLIHIYQ